MGRTKEEQDEVRRRIEEVQLQTAELTLARTKDENQAYLAKKDQQKRHLAHLQESMKSVAQGEAQRIRQCRHRMGGYPGRTHRGDGKPCVVRHKMPFGEWRVFCLRCPMVVYEPNPALQATHPDDYAKVKAFFDRMYDLSEESGLEPSEGPTFMATKDGVPYRPIDGEQNKIILSL
jgi:hypothetical protein